ncbi:transglycosylase SLT domain-containing protein [Roseomonas chloroacetimidivorans]|uniref:transglycosylase SLT domain-containing protein n=1 Tax=Roseomonas chloroacetimidivorans TaxID=1766656 RepID=UPI003C77AF87
MSDPLTTAAFLAHLAACVALHPVAKEAPAARTLATAQAESGLRPLAIGDNETGRSYFPATREAAVAKARELLALGHRIDAGAMQITDRNWSAYGLTPETVFDAQANICAGARILGEAFQIERRAACRYNTGRPDCRRESGTNGYPERVDAAAASLGVLPAPPASPVLPPAEPALSPVVIASCGPAPAPWDGWAMQAHESCSRRAVSKTAPRSSPNGAGAPSVVAFNQPPAEPR